MGVGQQSADKYYGVYEGKVSRSFKEPTKASKARVNKEGRTVNEEFYDYIEGLITSIKVKEHDKYGRSWIITFLDDDGDTLIWQLSYSGGYAGAFLKILPNVDLTEPVRCIPSYKENAKGKKQASVFIKQDGVSLKWAFTKDNKNGLPDLVKIIVKGKEQWDDTAQMQFLYNMVMDEIVPHLPKVGKAKVGGVGKGEDVEELGPDGEELEDGPEPIEDLPF